MSPKKKDKIVMLRVAAEDLDAWRAAAEREDMTVPDWLRRLAKAAAQKSAAKKPKR